MREVWKYPLTVPTLIGLEAGHRVVAVGVQDKKPFIWIEHDTSDEQVKMVEFEVYGTGHPIPSNRVWVGTFLDGPFVWHVYVVSNSLA